MHEFKTLPELWSSCMLRTLLNLKLTLRSDFSVATNPGLVGGADDSVHSGSPVLVTLQGGV